MPITISTCPPSKAALGLALSSTAIALQVMGERNLLPTGSGQSGFSILLFQDVAAIPILALLPLLAAFSQANTATAIASIALEAIKIIAIIGAIILGGLLAQGGEFAFVVFQAAAGARVFPAETASLLIGAVAISMLASPLLLVAIDKLFIELFEQRYPHHRDRAKVIAVVKQGRRQLEEQMAQERAQAQERLQRGQHRPGGWDD